MKIRVFVFDDDDGIRTLLRRVLERRGYEVKTFPRPVLCQKCQCQDGRACTDLIISDVEMPRFTGLEFIENQKKIGCKAPHVALMSGNWSESDLRQAQKLGCHIFHKPLILTALNEWLDACEKK